MEINKEITVLDKILKYLLFIKEYKKPYLLGTKEIDYSFQEYNDEFLELATNKLVKDRYANNILNVISFSKNDIGGCFEITFEGLVHIKNGGYALEFLENQKKEKAYARYEIEQRKQSASLVRLNRWLVFGAIVVAIDSILNTLKYFHLSFCDLQKVFGK